MKHAPKWWLIAYDIADPYRLARVHRLLKRRALPVQFSLYLARVDDVQIQALMDEIAALIEPRDDDIRAYRVPKRVEIAQLGAQPLTDGIALCGDGLENLLRAPVSY